MSTQPPPSTGFGLLNKEDVRRRHILGKALLIGIFAGLLASAFRAALIQSEVLRIHVLARFPHPWNEIVSIAFGAVLGGIGVWLVARFAPEASGSGIPHLKSVLLGERELHWRRVLPVKFFGGLFGIGGGMALGREGPTIQMGGACGLAMGELFRVKRGEGERKALIAAGAAAGLAAAFNAPLAGVVFVVEELQGNFTPVIFVAAFLASVASDIVSRLLLGGQPVLMLRLVTPPTVSTLPFAVGVGLVAGLLGLAFNLTLIGSLDLRDRYKFIPSWAVGGLAGALAGSIGGFYPGVVGSGNDLLENVVNDNGLVLPCAVLLVIRFGLTLSSYGTGAAGGIFAPLLVIGSLAGLGFGRIAQHVVPAWIPHPEAYAILGMGALFTATVRAPLTGIVLMVELTGEYGFMLPLLVSCLVAYGVAEAFRDEPIYEALRERSLRLQRAAGASPAVAAATHNETVN